MTWASLLVLLFAQAPVEENVGQLTATLGNVSITRGGVTSRGTDAAVLNLGDSVATQAGATALVYLRPGVSIYVGESTEISATGTAERVDLTLRRGEIRVTNSNPNGLVVLTPFVEARIKRGVLRASAAPTVVRFWAERGPAELTLREEEASRGIRGKLSRIQLAAFRQNEDAERKSLTLLEGQQITFILGKGFQPVEPGDPEDWTIDVNQLLLALGARASQNRRDAAARNADAPAGEPDTAPTDELVDREGPTTPASNPGANFALGTTLASSASGSAGGLFSDANQDTLSGRLTTSFRGLPQGSVFPGNIFFVVGQTTYTLTDVKLATGDQFSVPAGPNVGAQFWSIGLGEAPASQIVTGIGTGTSPNPQFLPIPEVGAYLVRLDQYGVNDPARPGAGGNQALGVAGLVGETPVNPDIQGATPLLDERSRINDRVTFALGEFSVSRSGDNPQFGLRRGDQDRKIIKDPDGNDNLDQVTPNPDVTQFNKVPDPRFFPENPRVYVPGRGPQALSNLPRFGNLDMTRRAAATTLMAHELRGFAARTGQTRFVLDGKIVDISGYRGP